MKILFITSRFLPYPSANGICVQNLAKELQKEGHTIYCISAGDTDREYVQEDIRIYSIRESIYSLLRNEYKKNPAIFNKIKLSLWKAMRCIWNMLTFYNFPNVTPIRAEKVYKKSEEIIKNDKIDMVIAAFRPYEALYTIEKIKKKHPEIKTIAWYLDLVRGTNPFGKKLQRLFEYLCYKDEKKLFTIADKILLPQNSKEFFAEKRYDFAFGKIGYFGFPLFVKPDFNEKTKFPFLKKNVNIVYAGTIDGKNRSVSYLITLINEVNKLSDRKVVLHLLGHITEVIPASLYVKLYGAVEQKVALQYIASADVLLNIGNCITYNMVPSKIYQLFATGKKIINLVADRRDESLPEFEKYPLVCNIEQYHKNIDKDTEKIREFINNDTFEKYEFNDLKKMFYINTPEYMAKLLQNGKLAP